MTLGARHSRRNVLVDEKPVSGSGRSRRLRMQAQGLRKCKEYA
jgi:hypothetical protein